MNKKIGEILVNRKIITGSQLDRALKKQKEFSQPLGETLIRMGFVTEKALFEVLSKQLNIDYLNIAESNYQLLADPSLSGILPYDLCRKSAILPLFFFDDDGTKELTLAMADPLDTRSIREAERASGAHVIPVVTTRVAVNHGINIMFSGRERTEKPEKENKNDADKTVATVNRILIRAVELGASDIHIEPHAMNVHMRMRVDGVLQLISTFDSARLTSLVSRIKIMASEQNSLMRIEERRMPQDGSFARVIGGHSVDFRVSTFPTIYGEKVVVRVLDKSKVSCVNRVEYLAMPDRIRRQFMRCINQSSGIIIVTGPTGSGKTTTLHAAINMINDVGTNIVTIEDPVEYHAHEYVNQSSLMPLAGYTYPVAMRSILRQDPDVILIGEIRDLETAETAIQAALTGHLVFTTLHTDDSAGAIVRLVDLGIEQFLVSSTVVSAINQRLLRKVCAECAEEHVPEKGEMLDLGIDAHIADHILADPRKYSIRRGPGCAACRQTGYKGRQGAYELLTITPLIKKLILQKKTSDVITRAARKGHKINMLFEEGLRLVLTGVTAMEELKRLQRGDYEMKPVEDIFHDAQ